MPGRFPSEWLDELMRRADAVQIISSYTSLKKNGSKYWGLCPFHGEKTASFSVDADKKLYYCFGCKAGGTIITFVKEMEHLSFFDACKYIADMEHLPMPELIEDPGYQKRRELRDRLYECNRDAARFFHEMLFTPAGKDCLEYLKGRGVNDATIRKFGLGASADSWDSLLRHMKELGYTADELSMVGLVKIKEAEPATEQAPAKPRRVYDIFRHRVMFPIIDQFGHVLGFGGRILDKKGEQKYLNTADTPIFNKRLGVYAANLLKKERNLDRVILVEGYMDVIALSQFGIRGVVATLGTSLTPEQAQLLRRFAPKVYLSYDGDGAGQHAILRGLDIFASQGMPARVLDFPDGLDPDEFIRRDGAEAFRNLPALSPETYRMRRLRDQYDLTTQDGKTEYARACASILANLDPVELENKIQELTLQTGFSREVLLSQVQSSRPKETPANAKPSPSVKSAVRAKSKYPAAPHKAAMEITDTVRAQEMIISLLASGNVPAEEVISSSDFTDPLLHTLFLGLALGKSPAALVAEQEDPEDSQRATQLMMDLPVRDMNERLEMLHQCQRQIHLANIEKQLQNLTAEMKSVLSAEKKRECMEQFQKLTMEKKQLKQ